MCGIFAVITKSTDIDFTHLESMKQMVKFRGPDGFNSVLRQVNECISMEIWASVLHLRGNDTVLQPLSDEDGNVFCWNGEIFGGSINVNESLGDTRACWERLSSYQERDFHDHICRFVSDLRGPFALVYYQAKMKRLYFGRDRMGRRSLMIYADQNTVVISSVTKFHHSMQFSEVTTDGLHYIDLSSAKLSSGINRWGVGYLISPYPESSALLTEKLCLSLYPSVLEEFKNVFLQSMSRRLLSISPNHPKTVSILFSGGLDCSLIAAFAHLVLPPDFEIDLLNVAFENPRVLKSKQSPIGSDKFSVPDRKTGKSSFDELSKVFPGRVYNFVEINVPFEAYNRYKSHIMNLMLPNNTVMDLSISAAFWFASSTIYGFQSSKCYSSLSRILLSGLGADELFGGYSHHRSSYLSGSSEEEARENLLSTLKLDLARLPYRNCGRDDRLFSDHGKEVRLPFLDEDLVRFTVERIPLEWKCRFRDEDGLEIPRGKSEKMFLRQIASNLGLANIAWEPKRAIQFGAKTAKMEKSERGNEIIDFYL